MTACKQGDIGEAISLSQVESNITLTAEQREQGEQLLAAEADYGNEHC